MWYRYNADIWLASPSDESVLSHSTRSSRHHQQAHSFGLTFIIRALSSATHDDDEAKLQLGIAQSSVN
jgi:hypothetical protein